MARLTPCGPSLACRAWGPSRVAYDVARADGARLPGSPHTGRLPAGSGVVPAQWLWTGRHSSLERPVVVAYRHVNCHVYRHVVASLSPSSSSTATSTQS